MKKLKIVGILAAAILISGVISIPLINNHAAYKVEKALCEIPLPKETELIESLSQAGKLTGNGNGMQYFGAILIKSELSLEIHYCKNWICVDIKIMEDRCIMKQRTLVTLLIIETVILAFVLLGKGTSGYENAQNAGDDSTNISWNVSGQTEIFREESPDGKYTLKIDEIGTQNSHLEIAILR